MNLPALFKTRTSSGRPLIKRFRLSAFASMSLLGTCFAQVESTPYWDQYGSKPIEVEQKNRNTTMNMTFIKFENEMFFAELDGGAAEISLPPSESLASMLSYKIDNTDLIQGAIAQKNYKLALELMRPEIYPLVKFHKVPSLFKQIHGPLQMLLKTLVLDEQLEEAEDLLSRMQLDVLSIEYSRIASELIGRHYAVKNYDAIERISIQLPVEGIYSENITKLIETADLLRAARRHKAVITLYKNILPLAPEAEIESIKIWLAYSLLLNNQTEESTMMFEGLKEPQPNEKFFSLYKLLQGGLQYHSSNYSLSLDILTRGYVRARTSYDWVPEMLHLIGDCYSRTQDSVAARNVWKEILSLYPDSPWANRAAQSLKKLPDPT